MKLTNLYLKKPAYEKKTLKKTEKILFFDSFIICEFEK